MPKTIDVELTPEGVEKCLRELKEYFEWVERKTNEIREKLAIIGAQEASIRFASAMYDGVNDVYIDVQKVGENAWKIVAQGDAVCFIEFGAGVHFNGVEPYPKPRPQGVVGIGEYGLGLGKYDGWYYLDDKGELVYTHGNPAAMPMYYAGQEMRRQLLAIAKEVFGN